MAKWKIEFSKSAYKYYKKLDYHLKKRIDNVLYWLANSDVIKLKPIEGEDDVYRIRVGKYRLLLKIFYTEKAILIFNIGSRGDIYKKWKD